MSDTKTKALDVRLNELNATVRELRENLRDCQRELRDLRRRNDLLTTAVASAFVSAITWVVIQSLTRS